ncbi:MAG: biotin carboxylase N-terminal domain-containing protein [Isosphaeraceae bacterium]
MPAGRPPTRQGQWYRDGRVSRKLLVANRGEIAIRIFRSAHELGLSHRGGLPARGPLRDAPAQGRRGLPGRPGRRADP